MVEQQKPYQAKLNSGALFKNTRNDRSDMSGQIEVGCPVCGVVTAWWINGWNKISKGGLYFISIALKPKMETATAAGSERGNRA
jgi:hypothetical protein